MDVAAALLGFLTALLGLVLAGVTLSRKIIDGIKAASRDVLVESGLIKPGRKESVWPNGSDTLPDFLDHLWETQKDIQHKLEG